MDSYSVRFFQDARDELARAPFPYRRALNHAIVRLKSDPRPSRSAPIGDEDHRRLRIDDWKILYEVDDASRTVTVVEISK